MDLFGNLVHNSLSVKSDDSGKGDIIHLLNNLRGILVPLIIELHENVGLLELLEGKSDDLSGSLDVVVSSLSLSLLVAENGLESSDSGLGLEEDLSGQGSSSDVEPVWVMGRDILGISGLDVFVSGKRSDFLLNFELLGEGLDEGLSRDVLDCNTVGLFVS